MKLKNSFYRLILSFFLIVTICFCISLFYKDYHFDKYYLIKPLPAQIPLQIRVDEYGDGHFGSPRGTYRHRGIDILAKVGTPVLACKSGKVIKIDYDRLSGNYVIIEHKDGLSSYYLHLKDVNVKENQKIRQGELVGSVGKTGNAYHEMIKPHLHFEIRKDNVAQDIQDLYKLEPFE